MFSVSSWQFVGFDTLSTGPYDFFPPGLLAAVTANIDWQAEINEQDSDIGIVFLSCVETT